MHKNADTCSDRPTITVHQCSFIETQNANCHVLQTKRTKETNER